MHPFKMLDNSQNSFYEPTVILILKPNKYKTKKANYTNLTYDYRF